MDGARSESTRRTLGEWIAIGGSVLAAISIVLLAAALVSLTSELGGPTSTFDWASLIPAFVIASGYLVLAYGLARRNRAAYVVGFVLNCWTFIGTSWLLLTDVRFGMTLIPYAIALPALLVVVGLASAWRAFWRRA